MKNTFNLKNIQLAATQLSNATEEQRDLFLKYLSETLLEQQNEVVEANRKDTNDAKRKGLPSSFLERLILDEKGIKQLVLKLKNIEKLQSHLGEVIEETSDEQGLTIKKVRVPLGVIAIIYEARPEVTIDVAALCVKSGNAVILKGGSEAVQTNQILYNCISTALEKAGFMNEVVSFISSSDRKITDNLLKQDKYIDLVIARGGYELVRSVIDKSSIPVLAHAAGGARIYIDKSADFSVAQKIIINAKTSKPAACNSIDTIVVHQDIATTFIPSISTALSKVNVEIVTNEDWDKEFLGLAVNIKVVQNIDEAIGFINEHSKKHSEGIVASDTEAIEQFTNSVDAAALFVNCSTRLHDWICIRPGVRNGYFYGQTSCSWTSGTKRINNIQMGGIWQWTNSIKK